MKIRRSPSVASLIIVGICSLLLAGCSTTSKATYSSVEELRAAFENAGGSCPNWTQDDAVTDARESGNCGANTVMMVFDSAEEANEKAGVLRQMLSAFDLEINLLVGENWVVNSPDAAVVEPSLGGKLIEN